MLIDKPRCNFKNCRYCFDGNCISADKYENCQLTDLHSEIAKLTVDLDNAKREVTREILADLKRRIHDKAIYPKAIGVYSFINIKVFDAVLNNVLIKYTEGK